MIKQDKKTALGFKCWLCPAESASSFPLTDARCLVDFSRSWQIWLWLKANFFTLAHCHRRRYWLFRVLDCLLAGVTKVTFIVPAEFGVTIGAGANSGFIFFRHGKSSMVEEYPNQDNIIIT